MQIYTEARVSPVWQINKADLKQVLKNMAIFLAPLALIYLLQINGVLQNRELHFDDLVPTRITQGALELWVLNVITDFIRKLTNR